jgi:hypothetical protein
MIYRVMTEVYSDMVRMIFPVTIKVAVLCLARRPAGFPGNQNREMTRAEAPSSLLLLQHRPSRLMTMVVKAVAVMIPQAINNHTTKCGKIN